MIVAKKVNGGKIISYDMEQTDVNIHMKQKYECINFKCKTKLVYTTNTFFKHEINILCSVNKFYKNIDNDTNNPFYKKWLNRCKNTCNVLTFNNGFIVDIVNKKGIKYMVRYNEVSKNFVKNMLENMVDYVILSGDIIQSKIYKINNKHYINFTTKNNIMNYDGYNISILIDNNVDKIILLKKDFRDKFIIAEYGIEISLISMKTFLDKLNVVEPITNELKTYGMKEWTKDNEKLLLKYDDNSNKLTDVEKYKILFDCEYIFDGYNDDEYNHTTHMKYIHNTDEYDDRFKDDLLLEGMKIYFEYHGLDDVNINKIIDRYNLAKRYDAELFKMNNDYFICHRLKKIFKNGKCEVKTSSKAISIMNSTASIANIHDGVNNILLCWYNLTYINGLHLPSFKKYISKYRKFMTKLKDRCINNDIFLLCYMIPFNVIDEHYLKNITNNKHDANRLLFGIKYMINKENIYYIDHDTLNKQIEKNLGVELSYVNDYFKCIDIYLNPDKNIYNDETHRYIYIYKKLCLYEDGIKMYIERLLNSRPYQITNLDSLFPPESIINPFDEQWTAIKMSLNNNISIITGGPGVGKSMTIAKICEFYNYNKTKYNILAFTGTAVQVVKDKLSEKNVNYDEKDIMTIDKFVTINTFQKSSKLDISALIIDEFSMVSLKKFYQLIKIMEKNNIYCQIIIVGDPDQLPSIKIGNLLNNLLDYGTFSKISKNGHTIYPKLINNSIPTTKLVVNQRVDKDNYIITLIQHIKDNNSSAITKINNAQFQYSNELNLVFKIIEQYKDDIENTMILIHTKKGEYGTIAINRRISDLLINNQEYVNNPFGKQEQLFKIGDRVMCIKNGIYNDVNMNNGDIFYIIDIDQTQKFTIGKKRNNNIQVYEIFKGLFMSNFQLGWAMTVHKAQGKEWSRVVIIMPKIYEYMLTKNLLYTAVTRCKKECTILCEEYSKFTKDKLLIDCMNRKQLIYHTLLQNRNMYHGIEKNYKEQIIDKHYITNKTITNKNHQINNASNPPKNLK